MLPEENAASAPVSMDARAKEEGEVFMSHANEEGEGWERASVNMERAPRRK